MKAFHILQISLIGPTCAVLLRNATKPRQTTGDSCALELSVARANATVFAQHLPGKADNLREYKSEAEGCLSWCAAHLSRGCFRGCLDTCSKNLGPPFCTNFKDEPECMAACEALSEPYECLKTVDFSSTHECSLKFMKVDIPKDECKLR
mmetsp:Transcript_117893/g.184218  ORF Transcript_117893/g.184218 Transcript_117893/m.184218 type:complete len:150 (+) Transcript_117893:25-474(+)